MSKKNKNICKGLCGICNEWQKDKCEGIFQREIRDHNGDVLIRYNPIDLILDSRYKEGLEEKDIIFIEVSKLMEKVGYITKNELMQKVKYGPEVTDDNLKYYVSLGLIEKPIREGISKISGSVSYWKKGTEKILYVIKKLKDEGYKIKLEEMKYWFNLLNLDKDNIKEIQEILNEGTEFDKQILHKYNMTPKQRNNLLKNNPLQLLDYKKLICRADILIRVILVRAYEELDDNEIIELEIKNSRPENITTVWKGENISNLEIKCNPVIEALDNTEIVINLKIPEITVTYKEPVSKTVLFRAGSIEVL